MSKTIPPLGTPKDVALYCTLRRSLRKAPDFLFGRDQIVMLTVPPGYCAEDYDNSAASLIRRLAAERDDMAYVMIAATDKPRVIIKRLTDDYSRRRRVLILRETGAEMPLSASLGIDIEIDLSPISAMDLRIGCRRAYQIAVTHDQACAMLEFPLDHLSAALRRGRPPMDVLHRLESVAAREGKPTKRASASPLLEDMVGYGSAKSWGLELAKDLNDWRSGTLNWSDVDTGIVLSGPPGTGKTQFAAALARQCDVPIIATSLGRWQAHGHLGDLLKAMRGDFNRAKECAPCILFCDELDSFGDRNSFSHDNKDYSIQVVNGFLEHLDGLDGREGVVVIGATNDISRIDPAILRSGRLDRHVAIELPDASDRLAILQQHLGQGLPVGQYSKLITATNGFSGADLAKVARDAKRLARRAKRDIVFDDLLVSLPDLIPITGKHRWSLAVHEAGHVAAVILLAHGVFHGAMIVDHTRNDGATSPGGMASYELPSVAYRTAETYRNQIVVLLAGMAAEEVFFGAIGDGSGAGSKSDLAQATKIATVLQTYMGMGNRLRHSLATEYSDLENLRNIDAAVRAWVDDVLETEFARAKELVRGNRAFVELIANELDATGVVSNAQVEEMRASVVAADEIETAA
ncbi:AAA family ATPase [Endobacterium cereale]|uniref:AAA family ATPase n=1 Tax=Endobacterium cereale TaxID=2663029 RepID=UPI002B46E514|nr:AAA family ATPase [Endobacterium cereale]MEB2845974.1 AAA family ATPase [Endobacterium cereale]